MPRPLPERSDDITVYLVLITGAARAVARGGAGLLGCLSEGFGADRRLRTFAG